MQYPKTTGESLVVPSHIRQMQMWTIRKGLEFYPTQDTPEKHRLKLINRIVEFNKLDLYYNAIVKDFLVSGGVLWHLRQTETGDYQILWYDKDHYRVFYSPDGLSISRVTISYPYQDQVQYNLEASKERWVKLEITAEWIRVDRYNYEPQLDESSPHHHHAPFASTIYENTLGFIPCVESPNNPDKPASSGNSEFDLVSNQIAAEDQLRCSMLQNLTTFGNPTLVTSLAKDRVFEQFDNAYQGRIAGNQQYSWAAQQGFQSMATMVTRRAGMPSGLLAKTRYGIGGWASQPDHVVKVVGNVRDTDRFAYLQVEPVSNDQWMFAKDYKQGLHEALGGIDPLGDFATFGELKSLHGKVAATANQKSLSLWTFGLTKVFEMAIWIEEQIYQVAAGQLLLQQFKPMELTVDLIQMFYESGNAPPSLPGIPPFGSREVKWRHKGPVFEDSPDDKLQLSIVCRNLQELGVGSLEAMRYLFPDKTEAEIKALLTGVPFRYIQQTVSSMQSLLQLQQQLFTVPDPQNPNVPLASRFDVSPILGYALNNLMREISYGAEYESSSSTNSVPSPAPGNGSPVPYNGNAPGGSPGSAFGGGISSAIPGSSPAPGFATSYTGLPGQPPMGSLQPDFSSTLPSPGSTLDSKSTPTVPDSWLPANPAAPSSQQSNPRRPAPSQPTGGTRRNSRTR
jgi:hypothetical protein